MGLYLDIGAAVVLLIGIIVGTCIGFNKQFTGLLGGFGALIGGLLLCSVVTNALLQIPAVFGVSESVGNWFSGIEGATTPVASLEELQEVLSGGVLAIMGGLSENIWNSMQEMNFQTIAQYFGWWVWQAILSILAFVVCFLVIKYLFKGLRKLLEMINKVSFFKVVDKVFGGIWGAVMTYTVVIGVVLTLFEVVMALWLPDLQTQVYPMFEESVVMSFAHSTNFIGSLIAGLFGVQLPTLPFVPAA